MKKLTYILLAITLILGIFSSCSDEEKEHKFVNMSELNFGDGIYRPNPFKFLDNIPPFSWMGMPDSVKKVVELQISFNEDAVRSHASGRIILVDHNGNKIKGIVINGNALNEVNIPSGSKSVIIPISFTVNPAVGDSILHGSVMVVGNELDQVNDIHLTPQATPIALWKLTHKTGINWLRWIILFALIALLCVIGYFIYKNGNGILQNELTKETIEHDTLDFSNATVSNAKKKHEGLTKQEKQEIKKRTGWSTKIVDAIRTMDEALIYMNAGLVEGEVNGKLALIQPKIDGQACNDPKWPDWSNKELAEEGYPPRDKNGRPYELHHIGQNPDSPLAELTYKQHHSDGNFKILHTFDESSIDRGQFNKERKEYWSERSKTL